uniref:proline-rich protein 2-like n=1 Tax=Jaculus jaculus TaxID=51337 RepID=UPI001E1B3AA8|nr:proline-rich protein 2-like [Jaculus jaculus]
MENALGFSCPPPPPLSPGPPPPGGPFPGPVPTEPSAEPGPAVLPPTAGRAPPHGPRRPRWQRGGVGFRTQPLGAGGGSLTPLGLPGLPWPIPAPRTPAAQWRGRRRGAGARPGRTEVASGTGGPAGTGTEPPVPAARRPAPPRAPPDPRPPPPRRRPAYLRLPGRPAADSGRAAAARTRREGAPPSGPGRCQPPPPPPPGAHPTRPRPGPLVLPAAPGGPESSSASLWPTGVGRLRRLFPCSTGSSPPPAQASSLPLWFFEEGSHYGLELTGILLPLPRE